MKAKQWVGERERGRKGRREGVRKKKRELERELWQNFIIYYVDANFA